MYRAQEYRAGACVRVSPWHLDRVARLWEMPVTYTHLTLPTICSV